jgi:putative membrane protein
MRLPPFNLHPEVLLLFGTILAAYLWAWRRHVGATGDAEERARKTKFFVAGVLVLAIGASWPMHDLAERYLYSIHMVQHMLFTFAAAPLVLAGLPAWMLRSMLRPVWLFRVVRFITRPVMALVIFNGVLLAVHWPAMVTLTAQSEWFHFGAHVVLVGASLLMWWPVLSPLPELPPLPPPGQMIYLFLQSLVPTIPASFLTFGSTPLYKVYIGFPRIWGISALLDMRIAGLTMKIIGGLILWGFITAIFFRWYNEEQRAEGWDALRYRDVEHEVRSGLTK